MAILDIMRSAVVFLIVATTLFANLDDNIITRLGMEVNVDYALLFSLLCTLLLSTRHALIVAAVVLLSLNANMPVEFTLNFGIDRDIYLGLMLALVSQPVLARVLAIN